MNIKPLTVEQLAKACGGRKVEDGDRGWIVSFLKIDQPGEHVVFIFSNNQDSERFAFGLGYELKNALEAERLESFYAHYHVDKYKAIAT